MDIRRVLTVLALACGLAPSSGAEQVRRFRDWAVTFDTAFQEASTSSDSGASLGVFCVLDPGQCIAYVTVGANCVQDAVIPVLVNSDSGATSLRTQCTAIDGPGGKLWVNVFTDYSAISEIMLRDNRVGIAIPFENGSFKALRFSLVGSNDAIAAASTPPARRSSPVGDEVF